MHSFDLSPTRFVAGGSNAASLADPEAWSWLVKLEPGARAEWRRRLQWVTLVELLAEEQLLRGNADSLAQHFVVPRQTEKLGVSWCEAWQRYVVAVHRYCRPKVMVPGLEAHHEMLLELGGNIFCLLPEVDWSLRRAIAHFGALDQFFSQLLGVRQDAQRGRCHFPLHVLASFGLSPQEVVNERCLSNPAYTDMLRYWLDEYLPTLRFEAAEFVRFDGLPRALRLLRESCLRRHARIERTIRESRLEVWQAEAG